MSASCLLPFLSRSRPQARCPPCARPDRNLQRARPRAGLMVDALRLDLVRTEAQPALASAARADVPRGLRRLARAAGCTLARTDRGDYSPIFLAVFALTLPHIGEMWRPNSTAGFFAQVQNCKAPWNGGVAAMAPLPARAAVVPPAHAALRASWAEDDGRHAHGLRRRRRSPRLALLASPRARRTERRNGTRPGTTTTARVGTSMSGAGPA